MTLGQYSFQQEDLGDFTYSKYTAIVSDLHLCEEEPVHPKHPLWKRYKNRDLFFDDEFFDFLKCLDKKTKGESIELILNGDIFDFDSVTAKPEFPTYKVSFFEKHSGLHPQEEKSRYKIKKILKDHKVWVEAIRWFLLKGHRVIFVIGNHDLELHWWGVQKEILKQLNVPKELERNVRYNEWFYISNQDTLIEHGNQYDPYCMAQDPIHPFVLRSDRLEVRVPFGNLATRYMINNMGFFNPHVDTNYIMTAYQYVKFFFKYMLRAQPMLMLTWFSWSTVVLVQSFVDRLRPSFTNPLNNEDKIEYIAAKANATPRMVRELRELFVPPAASYPLIIARELWLDRAFLALIAFYLIIQAFLFLNNLFSFSFSIFWMLIPLALFLPFFIFYSQSVTSDVVEYKEPREKTLWVSSIITKVNRVVYGHTHIVRHELIGPVEHLNSGTWSPAFLDVECKKSIGRKTYVFIEPTEDNEQRQARLFYFEDGEEKKVFSSTALRKKRKIKEVQTTRT